MVDEIRQPRQDRNSKLLYKTGPYPSDIPGDTFLQPNKKTNLPTQVTVGECPDEFDIKLENNDVRNMQFKIRFSKDDSARRHNELY